MYIKTYIKYIIYCLILYIVLLYIKDLIYNIYYEKLAKYLNIDRRETEKVNT